VWYLDTRRRSRLWMLNLHDRPLPPSSPAEDISPRRQNLGEGHKVNKQNPAPPKMVARDSTLPTPKAGSPLVRPQARKIQSPQSPSLDGSDEQETPEKFKIQPGVLLGEATRFRETLDNGGGVKFRLDEPCETEPRLSFVKIDGIKLYSDEPHALTITSSPEEEETFRQIEAEFGNANIGIA
jgi:hypothetical protein